MGSSSRRGARPDRHAVGDVMRSRWISVEPRETLYEAYRLMRLARLRHLPVVGGGILVGILSYRDLLEAALERLGGAVAAAHFDDDLRGRSVDTAMRDEPHTVETAESLRAAFERMVHLGVGCLPVVERSRRGPRIVGLVTESDLLRAAYDPFWRPEGRGPGAGPGPPKRSGAATRRGRAG